MDVCHTAVKFEHPRMGRQPVTVASILSRAGEQQLAEAWSATNT